jgi:hypothetical protein
MGNLVRQSVSIDVPNAKTLVITLPDFSVRTITLTGSDLTIKTGSVVTPINSDDVTVTSFSVTEASESARVSFGIRSDNLPQIFDFTTAFARRNNK